jgi:hypothetical protein
MKNPWAKKNPFMSLWSSGANTVVGAARGRAKVATKRDVVAFWTAVLTRAEPKKRKVTR